MDINVELNRIMNAAIDKACESVKGRRACLRCHGQGVVEVAINRHYPDEGSTNICCPICHGDGFVDGEIK